MVRRYLDLSTVHIREETSLWLSEQAKAQPPLLVVYAYEEGFFIPVPEEPDDAVPMDLLNLFGLAADNDATLLRLDRDGEQLDGLAEYDW